MRPWCIALLLAGCAASAKEQARSIDTYLAAHPAVTRDEGDRMRHRHARPGDPLERVKLAWLGCQIDLQQEQGALVIYSVRVPIGVDAIYVGAQQEQVTETGQVMLTFQDGKLTQHTVVSNGNLRQF
jgi:hypothetical protein